MSTRTLLRCPAHSVLISVLVHQVIFVGTLTSGGLKVSLKDGQLRIDKEGRHRKFVKKVRLVQIFQYHYAYFLSVAHP